MKPFLQRVAEHYATLSSEQLQQYVFVFPNRRAGLFFLKHLSQIVEKPVFAPEVVTVNQLFQSLSKLTLADPIELLFRLYEVYKENTYHSTPQSFDDFLFWGRMMLNDFGEVDANRVDADKLFRNLADLKDIDIRFESLSEDVQESVKTFIKDFQDNSDVSANNTQSGFGENNLTATAKQKFFHIWRSLLPIYKTFRNRLYNDGKAYMGMLCRDVIEHIDDIFDADSLQKRTFVFVGFNALNATEQALMTCLHDHGCAQFCWDYAHPWLTDPHNRASLFSSENLRLFPNELKTELENQTSEIAIHLLQLPSSTGQATEVAHILSSLQPTDWTQVGVVLPAESMLLPLLEVMPDTIGNVNVTMGYPLKMTPVYSLLQHLSELQLLCVEKSGEWLFYHKPVMALLMHPYVKSDKSVRKASKIRRNNISYVSQSLFEETEQDRNRQLPESEKSVSLPLLMLQHYTTAKDALSGLSQVLNRMVVKKQQEQLKEAEQLQNEYIYQTLKVVNRLERMLADKKEVCPSVKTLFSLLLGILQDTTVPFEGEPLEGLQVMGMLESRSLTFSKLILTDVNDEVLPGHPAQHSYIPYDLRHAFSLPTPERQDAVYAYNFFRLVSAANEVYLLQNTIADNYNSGEISRFVLQLEHQYHLPIDKQVLSAPVKAPVPRLMQVEKNNQVMRELLDKFCPSEGMESGHGLSASAINTYVSCPLRFYLEGVKGYKEAEKVEENIAANDFGTVIHNTMQQLYQPFEGENITPEYIKKILNDGKTDSIIENNYRKVYRHNSSAQFDGKDLLPLHVIQSYVKNILRHDLQIAETSLIYIGSEMKCGTQRYFTLTENGVQILTKDEAEKWPEDKKNELQVLLLKGTIDRVDIVNNQIRIIDYKTGAAHHVFPEDLKANLYISENSDHVRQTLFYCYIYENNEFKRSNGDKITTLTQSDSENKNITPYIYYVRNNSKSIEHEICSKNIQGYANMREPFEIALKELIKEIFDKNRPFYAKPKFNNCDNCQFRNICQ